MTTNSDAHSIGAKAATATQQQAPNINEIFGDLLTCTDSIIVHQCNMKSFGARGLAEYLFKKYPECDVYKHRNPDEQKLGSYAMRQTRGGQWVCNLFAQDCPGKGKNGRGHDSREMRLKWFRDALRTLAHSISNEKAEEALADVSPPTPSDQTSGRTSCSRVARDVTCDTDVQTSAGIHTRETELKAGDVDARSSDSSGKKRKLMSTTSPMALSKVTISGASHITSVGFPANIGCGLAGGEWAHYKAAICEFADLLQNAAVAVNVYHLKQICTVCGMEKADMKGKRSGKGTSKNKWTCFDCKR